MIFMILRLGFLVFAATGVVMAAEDRPQPTDPLSSSRAPDSNPTTGHSTFEAPNKPPGPWGEIPGGGGPSGYNDGAAQKAPQFEGEKFKSAQQSERDAVEKPGGRPPLDQSGSQQRAQRAQDATPPSGQPSNNDGAKDGASYEEQHPHHRSVSPGHLGPEGGSTADSGKAKQDAQARAEQEASKSSAAY
jgi:hypothetical protein